jgi:hypothetical protein
MEYMVKTQMVEDYDARRTLVASRSGIDSDFVSGDEMICCGEELQSFWLEDGRFGSVCRKCGQQIMDNTCVRYGGSPWIGVDLDGTLARDLGNRRGDEIGNPIEPMLIRVKKWVAEGKTVKIFTARASSPRQVGMIKKWLANHGLPDLEITNVKDLRMIELWDDRCVQVMTNSGEPVKKAAPKPNRHATHGLRGLGRRLEPSRLLSRIRIFLAL